MKFIYTKKISQRRVLNEKLKSKTFKRKKVQSSDDRGV